MTKWVADFEVESALSVSDVAEKLIFNHPHALYEIHISNTTKVSTEAFPLLSVQVIFEAEDISLAGDIAKQHLQVFLNALTFVTNHKFSTHHLLRIVDWTPGLEMRECYQFKRFGEIDSPLPLLENTYLDTLMILLKGNINQSIKRALKWFSRGISSTSMDDQFQCFWFVIELLAETMKPSVKVPDKCPKCQEPLFCTNCNETPTHRPFPKQAILHLIKKQVKGEPEKLFDKLSKIRNAVMHGDEISKIEKDFSVSFEDYVDTIGKVSWAAILNSFLTNSEREEEQINFIDVSRYVHYELTTKLHMKIGCPDKDNPQIEKVPLVEINMIRENDGKSTI